MAGKTLFEKIWDRHVIAEREGGQSLIYIDRHLCHDGSFNAFGQLREHGRTVRRPKQTFATPDHYTPTKSGNLRDVPDPRATEISMAIDKNCEEFGVTLFPWLDERQGIAHVVGPEQGITLPGIVLCCGDSHTSTHGALGCISFGIGASEVAHVLATQAIWQRRPKTMRITVDGKLGFGVSGKDVIIAIIRQISAAGGTGHAIEYAGSAIRDLSMEGRLTLCNMTIEGGARAGLVAPDETTFAYLKGRPKAPSGDLWEEAVAHWKTLRSDEGASYDKEVVLDVSDIVPQATWGTNPELVAPITGIVPNPKDAMDAHKRESIERAIAYMGLEPGMKMTDIPIDRVFIGSCTNGRIEDIRAAAEVAKGRQVFDTVRAMVVPGSGLVKQQAEEEGLDKVLLEAGFEWREPGCSMCLAMNTDRLEPGERCASTSNRNFEGRQGKGSRTHLVSPIMAAAAAIVGTFADPRTL